MTNYTTEQLEAWAGLGPWEWCENWLYVATPNPPTGPVLWYTANDDGVHADPNDAALIAAAPDLAAEVLRLRAEVAELKERIDHTHKTARHFYDTNKSNAGRYFLYICDILEPMPSPERPTP